MDEDIHSDVHLKEEINAKEMNVEIVERYLSILARVFKNLDAITNSELIYEIFEYLLETYCQFGFYLIDEYKESVKTENLKVREEFELDDDSIIGEEILRLLSRIVPVLIQAMLYDGIGQMNFKRVIENKIREYRSNPQQNQYKLFVLYFLFIDLDLKSHQNTIEDVFEEIKLPPLKVSTLFKLNFYLAFKAYNDKQLEQNLRNRIQKAQLKIDGKADVGEIQRALTKSSKRNLVTRRKNR